MKNPDCVKKRKIANLLSPIQLSTSPCTISENILKKLANIDLNDI